MNQDNGPALDPALPPPDLGFCADCRAYLKSMAQEHFALPNGQAVPTNSPMAAEIPIAMRRRVMVAPCTLLPQWMPVHAGSWCQQWKAKP